MDLQTIAEHLKSLGAAELKKLAAILEADVETDLGLTKSGTPVKPFSGGGGSGDNDSDDGNPAGGYDNPANPDSN
jgi:hypothetical protein